jgi:rhamnose utilization protein RhaD (predicted bifunctional aldolase and dehydrogenase)
VHDAIILENHGVVTAGKNLLEAYQRLELVERFAQIAVTAELLGGARLLPRSEVNKLVAARPRYGVSCHPDNADQLRTSDAPSAAPAAGGDAKLETLLARAMRRTP